jgi:hypothetical protein
LNVSNKNWHFSPLLLLPLTTHQFLHPFGQNLFRTKVVNWFEQSLSANAMPAEYLLEISWGFSCRLTTSRYTEGLKKYRMHMYRRYIHGRLEKYRMHMHGRYIEGLKKYRVYIYSLTQYGRLEKVSNAHAQTLHTYMEGLKIIEYTFT